MRGASCGRKSRHRESDARPRPGGLPDLQTGTAHHDSREDPFRDRGGRVQSVFHEYSRLAARPGLSGQTCLNGRFLPVFSGKHSTGQKNETPAILRMLIPPPANYPARSKWLSGSFVLAFLVLLSHGAGAGTWTFKKWASDRDIPSRLRRW